MAAALTVVLLAAFRVVAAPPIKVAYANVTVYGVALLS